ncbi:Redoxin-domain-containing protein [Pleurotus eryngii]|uniref:Redoxin-domain-containing protein n=1 Tax=Pleurotus eryngii TaxID=5323 RepID=A0A9P5ZR18_PLEER|nr:Redoxin-domain-containing protein [Pleurotus eryngii]
MTSIITGTAQAAHSAVASLLANAQIKPGESIPEDIKVKENDAMTAEAFKPVGTNVIVGVPGAFTGTCSAQVPKYIQSFEKFKEKGVNNVFVVAANDIFVMKAWKEQLAASGTGVRFIADDKGELISRLGLIFDASPLLGSPRSKRFVLITDGPVVRTVAVEEDPSQVTITAADVILAQL